MAVVAVKGARGGCEGCQSVRIAVKGPRDGREGGAMCLPSLCVAAWNTHSSGAAAWNTYSSGGALQ